MEEGEIPAGGRGAESFLLLGSAGAWHPRVVPGKEVRNIDPGGEQVRRPRSSNIKGERLFSCDKLNASPTPMTFDNGFYVDPEYPADLSA